MHSRPILRISVRIKLLSAFLIMTAVAAALLFYGLLTSTQQLHARTVRELELRVSFEGSEMRATLERVLQDVVTLSRLPAVGRGAECSLSTVSDDGRTQMAEQLRIFARAKKCYQPVQVRLLDDRSRGIVRIEDRGAGLVIVDPTPGPTGDDAIQPTAQLSRGHVFISQVLLAGPEQTPGLGGGAQVECATPVTNHRGETRGALAIRVRLDSLLLHVQQRPPDGAAFLADENGRSLAYLPI